MNKQQLTLEETLPLVRTMTLDQLASQLISVQPMVTPARKITKLLLPFSLKTDYPSDRVLVSVDTEVAEWVRQHPSTMWEVFDDARTSRTWWPTTGQKEGPFNLCLASRVDTEKFVIAEQLYTLALIKWS